MSREIEDDNKQNFLDKQNVVDYTNIFISSNELSR